MSKIKVQTSAATTMRWKLESVLPPPRPPGSVLGQLTSKTSCSEGPAARYGASTISPASAVRLGVSPARTRSLQVDTVCHEVRGSTAAAKQH